MTPSLRKKDSTVKVETTVAYFISNEITVLSVIGRL